jgi:hypothetical protein
MIENKKRSKVPQMMVRLERQRYRKLNQYTVSTNELRRKRTRSLIQLGGLIEKARLLETFSLPIGADFQKEPELKNNIAALFNGLLVLNEMANSEDVSLSLWSSQGLEALAQENRVSIKYRSRIR